MSALETKKIEPKNEGEKEKKKIKKLNKHLVWPVSIPALWRNRNRKTKLRLSTMLI